MGREQSLESVRGAVERFVAGAESPAVLDPGEEPIPLVTGRWSLSEWSGRLVLEAWDERRNLVRKISRVKAERRDRLELVSERFPKTEAELQIADLAAPHGVELQRRTSRAAFRERFQLLLAREWPGWLLVDLSVEANLEESLSPVFLRAFLRKGQHGIAVMAAPPDLEDCAGIVACGLIWLEYLRRREERTEIRALQLFVPLRREGPVAARVAWLNRARVDCTLRIYDERDRVGTVDLADAGNLESTLPPCRRPAAPNLANAMLSGFPPEVERVELSDGALSLRVNGLEFARQMAGKLTAGIARRTRCTLDTAVGIARELVRVRCAETEGRQNPLYTMHPEGWLEAAVREHPEALDASLRAAPLYGQAPVWSGAERGVIDLLGIDHTGRLAVIEIKASEDVQLPLQALDYWIRVRQHLAAGDFTRLGYFPGQMIRPEAPRILLVAPALEFHSTVDSLIGYLDPAIEFVRIGLAADWRKELRVMFRLRGSERP